MIRLKCGSKVTQRVNLIIKGPGGKVKHLNMEISEKTCSKVFSSIQRLWGIPSSNQMLSLGGQLLQPQTPKKIIILSYREWNLQLSIKGLGGGKTVPNSFISLYIHII